jgi:uroporphyrinogen decarboxylase
MDVFEMKRIFGDQLTFYGGVSTQRTLPFGYPEDVAEEVKKLIEVVGKGGGLIVSPAHAVPGDAKPENIARMIEVLESQ